MNTPDHNPQQAPAVPTWLTERRDAFKRTLLAEGAAKSTSNDYPRLAEQFVMFCLQAFGSDGSKWPIDAPERWYVSRGWVGKGQSYRNLANAALRGTIRWDRAQPAGQGFNIPDMEFPPSVAPPKRKPKLHTDAGATTHMNETNVQTNGATPPSFEPLNPEAPAPSAPVPAVASTLPAAPATSAPAASAPQPLPTYLPPQTTYAASPGMEDRQLARPRVVDKRQSAPRNSLGALLPPGGKLKIYRVSDGSDKQHPGERVMLSEPTEKDIRGYNDIATWIKENIHNVVEPLTGPRTSTVTYIVEQYDDQERLLPPPRRIALMQNANGQSAGNTGNVWGLPQAAPAAPAPGTMMDDVMRSFVRRMERVDQQQEEAARAHAEMIEKARNGGMSENQLSLQMLMMQKPPQIDVKGIIEDVVGRVQQIVKEAKPAPMPMLPMLPPPAPVKDPFDSPLLGRLVDAATNKPVAAPAPDPIAQMQVMAQILRPAVDPAVTQLQAQVVQLMNELRETKRNPNNDPMAIFTMMKMMDDVTERRMQRMGGGPTGVGEALASAIAAIPETIAALANAGAIQPRQGRPGAAPAPAASAPAASAQSQEPVATEAQVTALREIASGANAGDDAMVLNATLKLIIANAQAPQPWPSLNTELLEAITSRITTVDELGLVIQKLFQLPAFGNGAIVREFPGSIGRATQILAWNFPVICERLKVPPRELLGIEVPQGTPAAAAPAAPAVPVEDLPKDDEEEDDSSEEESLGDDEKTPAAPAATAVTA